MDFINLLGAAWPEGNFWAFLIKLFDVGNYAWTIILFTVVLKLVLSPLDIFQRYYTNKTSKAQAKLQPELEKLKKRYGQNQNLLYQKQNELYQKSGFSMKGSCIVMLVYMVVTLVVFLTLYNSLQSIAGFKIKNQYQELKSTYDASYNQEYLTDYLGIDLTADSYVELSREAQEQYILDKESDKASSIETSQGVTAEEATAAVATAKSEAQSNAQDKVVDKYLQIKDSWLWIRNIWRPDKATLSEISTFGDYKSATGDNSVAETEYNAVLGKLLSGERDSNQVNGYYILSILVVLVSFFSQWLMRYLSRPKNIYGKREKVNQPGMTKIMMFVLPIIMLLFTLRSSAIFSIYIITNSLMATLITPISIFISNKVDDKKEKQRKEAIKVDYRR